jgi:hypothetical protein
MTAKAQQSNITRMKVNDMVSLFVPLIANSKSGKEMPGVNLSGAPGVGKSDGVRCIARKLEEVTGKQVFVHDVRLLNMNPVDLRGIPSKDTMEATVFDDKGKEVTTEVAVARWLRPAIFQMNPSPNVINILFLDEITAAPQSVQASAYQLVLDRKVGEHKLPDNCFVFCAGNRVTDKSVAYRMPKALANRLCHIEIYADVDDWKKWAINSGIDSRIVGYINWKNNALFKFDPTTDDLAYATPRSWAMVNNFLTKIPDLNLCFNLIAGCIGIGNATEFKSYTDVYKDLPNIDDIFTGKNVDAPKSPDVNYALSSAIVSRVVRDGVTKKQFGSLFNWMMNWSVEFTTITIKDMITSPKVFSTIGKLPEFVEWATKNAKYLLR